MVCRQSELKDVVADRDRLWVRLREIMSTASELSSLVVAEEQGAG